MDLSLLVPNANASRVDIENWANSAGIKATYNTITNDSKANTNEILYNGVVVNGQSIHTTASQLQNVNVIVNLYVASENKPDPGNPNPGNPNPGGDTPEG